MSSINAFFCKHNCYIRTCYTRYIGMEINFSSYFFFY